MTQESPIAEAWKQRLLTLQPGDVLLHRFSPTGFYSSAVKNGFIEELCQRIAHQIPFTAEAVGEHTAELSIGLRGRVVYVTSTDRQHAESWIAQGVEL